MPSTTSDRKVQSRIKATNVARAARASPESSDTSSDRGEEEIEGSCLGPEDLDQPWPYEFKVNRHGTLEFTAKCLIRLQVRETVWVRIQEDGKWYRGTIVSSRSTTDKVREGTMVSIHPGHLLHNLTVVFVGQILASERLQRRQNSTDEAITAERRCQTRYRTSAGPAENQRFPRVMLL